MTYKIQNKKSVEKDLRRIPIVLQKKIRSEIDKLKSNPFKRGAIKIHGYENYFRLRIGEYRVIYNVHKQIEVLIVVKVGHRKNVYKFY